MDSKLTRQERKRLRKYRRVARAKGWIRPSKRRQLKLEKRAARKKRTIKNRKTYCVSLHLYKVGNFFSTPIDELFTTTDSRFVTHTRNLFKIVKLARKLPSPRYKVVDPKTGHTRWGLTGRGISFQNNRWEIPGRKAIKEFINWKREGF